MADDDVLEDGEQARREAEAVLAHDKLRFVVEHDCAVDDVSDEFASVAVAEGAVVDEFAGFAKIVQEETQEDDVAIDFRIERADGVAQLEQGQGVFEKAAKPGVVHALCGGGSLEVVHHGFVGEVDLRECFRGGVVERREDFGEVAEHLLDVAGCAGEQVVHLLVAGFGGLDHVDDQLQLALVGLGFTFEVDKAVGWEAAEDLFIDCPHAARHFACTVADDALEVGLALAGLAELGICD